ncbi:unnamed protein product [Dimorphilus gyrociliatus]|uniref:Uncharacterized protein n=1 Tax=Dimorphilus gyrociliatus TaxID=2664684 RepID=A0A7I8VKB8_9ANNE|nr:unnamed protein product [Dimorphilus gyrociliatus]
MDINDIGIDSSQSYTPISEIYARRLSNNKFIDLGLFGINSPTTTIYSNNDKSEQVYAITSKSEKEESFNVNPSNNMESTSCIKLPKLPFKNRDRKDFDTVNRVVLDNHRKEEKFDFHENKLDIYKKIDDGKPVKNSTNWCCLNIFSKQKHFKKKRGSVKYEMLNRY